MAIAQHVKKHRPPQAARFGIRVRLVEAAGVEGGVLGAEMRKHVVERVALSADRPDAVDIGQQLKQEIAAGARRRNDYGWPPQKRSDVFRRQIASRGK
jgi:hypothetical protein